MRARLVPVLWLGGAACLAQAAGFTLDSADVAPAAPIGQAFVYSGAGCAGGNRSPSLRWRNAPAGTAGFALSVFDPDGGAHGWWHWLVLDLPPQTDRLAAGASAAGLPPPARQLDNDFGTPGYGGPCPPPGAPHRYVFTIYALKTAHLQLPADAGNAAAAAAIRQQALGAASFTASYGR